MIFLFLRISKKVSKIFIPLDHNLKLAYFYLQIHPASENSSGGTEKNREVKNLKHRKTVENVFLRGYIFFRIIFRAIVPS